MVRTALAAAVLAAGPALVQAQSTSAPLIVTADVVSTCSVDVPRSAEASAFATMPVELICARGRMTPRVQRPIAPRVTVGRTSPGPAPDALLIIDF